MPIKVRLMTIRAFFPRNLQEPYRILRQKYGWLPESLYFYNNRHSAFLPVMDRKEYRDYLSEMKTNRLSAAELLVNAYGYRREELPGEIPDAETFLLGHAEDLCRRAEQHRKCFRTYLERCGIRKNDRLAVMDFIASGMSCRMLSEVMENEMDGYYTGRPSYDRLDDPALRRSYYLEDQVGFETLLKLETFMTSPEPALDHWDGDGRPVFQEEVRPAGLLELIAAVQEKAVRFCSRYLEKYLLPGEEIGEAVPAGLAARIDWRGFTPETYDDWIRGRIGEVL